MTCRTLRPSQNLSAEFLSVGTPKRREWRVRLGSLTRPTDEPAGLVADRRQRAHRTDQSSLAARRRRSTRRGRRCSSAACPREAPDPDSLHDLAVRRPQVLRHVILTRRTQTNEAARCAVLLPALASLPGPLALLEVGAAAGLTLLPDVYSYDHGGHRVAGLDPDAPTMPCRPIGPVPLPNQVPQVVWRAGIDLHPLDVNDDDDMAWLSCLIWPGEDERVERLHQAVAAGTGGLIRWNAQLDPVLAL
jgi:hypothetical protein